MPQYERSVLVSASSTPQSLEFAESTHVCGTTVCSISSSEAARNQTDYTPMLYLILLVSGCSLYNLMPYHWDYIFIKGPLEGTNLCLTIRKSWKSFKSPDSMLCLLEYTTGFLFQEEIQELEI